MNNREIITIEVPEGATYLNEFLQTLPKGIVNKKRTGCGATSVALENLENTIICCPTKQLINNKVSQYPNVRCGFTLFEVIEGVYEDDIKEYIAQCKANHQPVKIMVTYDSFHKVKQAIGDEINSYKVVVDEYQELLDACVYRDKAIMNLLQELRGIPNVTYLSATPIPYDYRPDELQGLDEYEIEWKEPMIITPLRFMTNKPEALVINMIKRHKQGTPMKIAGHEVGEYYFFVNSVKIIKSIIDNAGLTANEVKVVCADNSMNRNTLETIPISNISSSNKTFTFCTKTVFCGADIYSNSGLAVVVSSGLNKNTMLDIATDIQQIAGRIRNIENPFKDIVLHIFSTGFSCQNQSEFDAWLTEKINSAQYLIAAYNNLEDENQKQSIVARIRTHDKDELALYDEQTREVKLNTLKIKHFRYKFEAVDNVYRNGMSIREAYIRAGCDVSIAQHYEQVITDYLYEMNNTPSFEVLYEEYLSEKARVRFGSVTDRTKQIDNMNSLVGLACRYLTPEKVRALRYNSTDVRNEVEFHLPETQAALKARLREYFAEGGIYTDSEAKAVYQNALDELALSRTAKASELKEKYFVTTPTKRTIEGKRQNGFRVINLVIP